MLMTCHLFSFIISWKMNYLSGREHHHNFYHHLALPYLEPCMGQYMLPILTRHSHPSPQRSLFLIWLLDVSIISGTSPLFSLVLGFILLFHSFFLQVEYALFPLLFKHIFQKEINFVYTFFFGYQVFKIIEVTQLHLQLNDYNIDVWRIPSS